MPRITEPEQPTNILFQRLGGTLEVLQVLSKNLTSGKCYRDGVEITALEYADALANAKNKAVLVNGICNGTATIDDAPEDWRTELSQRVADRKTQADDDPELTAEEALDIILGGGTDA